MPLKKLNPLLNHPFLKPFRKKDERNFSEGELKTLAEEIMRSVSETPGVWIFLEGSLGAGKTSLARELIHAWAASAEKGRVVEFQGSPTYPIVHEYRLSHGNPGLLHIDLYRIESAQDFESRGFEAYLENDLGTRAPLVIVEWGSLFPDQVLSWAKPDRHPCWVIQIEILNEGRSYRIYRS